MSAFEGGIETLRRPSTAAPTYGRGPGGRDFGRAPARLELRRQSTGKVCGKNYLVAYDGSRLSGRAVRLAAWLAVSDIRDKVRLATLCKNGNEMGDRIKMLEDVERSLMQDCGLRKIQLLPKLVLNIGEGESASSVLAKAASGGHLVMGAYGKSIEDAPKPKRPGTATMNQLGKTTVEAMVSCKAPVIVAKPQATRQLDVKGGVAQRGSGRAGMIIVVPVDGNKASQKCFDSERPLCMLVAPPALLPLTRRASPHLSRVSGPSLRQEGRRGQGAPHLQLGQGRTQLWRALTAHRRLGCQAVLQGGLHEGRV